MDPMHWLARFAAFLLFPLGLIAAPAPVALDYYLPVATAKYDSSVPTPQQALGFQVGEWHLHHHELVDYLRQLAAKSDRVKLVEYARSHGRRPLIQLIITAPENHSKLEQIRKTHVAHVTDPDAKSDDAKAPIVVWLGYSIHGNESSGANASALIAFHLVAARDRETTALLKDAVILLDPCLNPDGFERFANWTNNHRGRHPSAERDDREHTEGWPSGRPNYYWFDLNRDWLPAVHPESQGRLKQFHLWQPNIVTDMHEMGNENRTYFFQPGFAKMIHPLTPSANQALTEKMAREHAKTLDVLGSLYYTGESFDDYYIGKGSTYPDLNGSVGVLFEQASSRGYHQDTEHGRLKFPFTIRNQVATSLSTLRAAQRLRPEFLEYQREFYRSARKEAAATKTKAHVFSAPSDPTRLRTFQILLERHAIESFPPASDVTVGEKSFPAAHSLVVPVDQRQFRLLNAFLETRTKFESAIFYDVSSWHLPSAFGLSHAELESVPKAASKRDIPIASGLDGAKKAYAYVFAWEPRLAPRALFRLVDAKVRCWTATRPFKTGLGDDARPWQPGSIVVPVGVQDAIAPDALQQLLATVAGESELTVVALDTGYHGSMPDIGSPSFLPIRLKNVAMVTGRGVGSVTAGAVWHHFDQVWQTPLVRVEPEQLRNRVLDECSTVILADTSFTALPGNTRTNLQDWVARGGNLIAIGSSVKSLAAQAWCKVTVAGANSSESADAGEVAAGEKTNTVKSAANAGAEKRMSGDAAPPKAMPYGEAAENAAVKKLDGVVLRATYDATHPLAFGMGGRPFIELTRVGTDFLKPATNPHLNPLHYAAEPLVSGYASAANIKALTNTTPVQLCMVGTGRVIYMTDNPIFRGYWLGSEKLLANAIFFGPLVKSSDGGEDDEAH